MRAYLHNGFHEMKTNLSAFLTFEASIHYYHHKAARDNLHSLLPCSRLIWVLRNPLSRAVSEYMHQAVKSKSYPSFQSLISAELAAIRTCRKTVDIQMKEGFDNNLFKCISNFKLKKFMISTAFYSYFINGWLEKFPRQQHYFLDYELFKLNPQEAVAQISTFLSLAHPPTLNYTWKYNKANTRDGKAVKLRSSIRISSRLHKEISREISPFVAKIYEVVHQNFDWDLNSLS